MKTQHTGMNGFQKVLDLKEAELARVLQGRDGIVIEKSADQMDEIQFATERDLEIRNVDRESSLLREVRAALRRIHDGSFGTCSDCGLPINPKRLAAVPWALRCIACQESADSDGQQTAEPVGEALTHAA
jgi:DnaK suppressor protein